MVTKVQHSFRMAICNLISTRWALRIAGGIEILKVLPISEDDPGMKLCCLTSAMHLNRQQHRREALRCGTRVCDEILNGNRQEGGRLVGTCTGLSIMFPQCHVFAHRLRSYCSARKPTFVSARFGVRVSIGSPLPNIISAIWN